MKTCSKCGEEKPLSEFYRNKDSRDGYRADCKKCLRVNVLELRMARQMDKQAYMREYGVINAEKLKNASLLRNYGITLDQYFEMFVAQDGKCAICKQPSEIALSIDHDHSCCPQRAKSCGQCIRGLLCGNCNNGLGRFQDSPDLLRAALAYLG